MKLVCSPVSCSAYQYSEEEREEVQSGADVDRTAVVVGRLLVHCAEQLVKPGQLDVNVCTHKRKRGVCPHTRRERVCPQTQRERVCPHTQRERVCP